MQLHVSSMLTLEDEARGFHDAGLYITASDLSAADDARHVRCAESPCNRCLLSQRAIARHERVLRAPDSDEDDIRASRTELRAVMLVLDVATFAEQENDALSEWRADVASGLLDDVEPRQAARRFVSERMEKAIRMDTIRRGAALAAARWSEVAFAAA